jgi:hypothetical protein
MAALPADESDDESFLVVWRYEWELTPSESPSLIVLKWLGEIGAGLARSPFIRARARIR